MSFVPSFLAVSGNLVGKIPVIDNVLASDEQEFCPNTLLDENYLEFEFQTVRNVALKLKLVNARG